MPGFTENAKGDEPMYARVVRYKVAEDKFGGVVPAFKDAIEQLSDADGNKGGYLLVDRDNCTALTITLWESLADLESSEVRASRLRSQAIESVEGEIQTVDRGEVAIDTSAAKTAV